MSLQRPGGVRSIALFNQRTDPSGKDYFPIARMLEEAASRVRHWLTNEVRRFRR